MKLKELLKGLEILETNVDLELEIEMSAMTPAIQSPVTCLLP